MQVTLLDGTGPLLVGFVKLQLIVSCVAPLCITVMVALVKDMSVITSFH